jgi:hypothetical protein
MTSIEIKYRLTKINFTSRSEKIKYLNIKKAPPKFFTLDLKIY